MFVGFAVEPSMRDRAWNDGLRTRLAELRRANPCKSVAWFARHFDGISYSAVRAECLRQMRCEQAGVPLLRPEGRLCRG